MKKVNLTWVLVLFFVINALAQEEKDIAYIKKYAVYAVQEMELYKIPASITLAQGLVETADGQSELAQNANNHFGIKCKKEWTGLTYRYTDDAYMECFRKYPDVQSSYRDHSKFLAERPYYTDLFKLDIKDYKGWAYGLKKAGYATNPKYAPILISRIEKYQLQRLDHLSSDEVAYKLEEWWPSEDAPILLTEVKTQEIPVVPQPPAPPEYKIPVPEQPKYENPLKRKQRHATGNYYVVAERGERLSDIAKTYNISIEKLLRFNELDKASHMRTGQNIFFRPKKSYGAEEYYTVEAGDNMYLISQKTGIKLRKLYWRNRMELRSQPSVGEVLLLQGRRKKQH